MSEFSQKFSEQTTFVNDLEVKFKKLVIREVMAQTTGLKPSIYDDTNTGANNVDSAAIMRQVKLLLDRKIDKNDFQVQI